MWIAIVAGTKKYTGKRPREMNESWAEDEDLFCAFLFSNHFRTRVAAIEQQLQYTRKLHNGQFARKRDTI